MDDDQYKVLGVSKDATKQEIKAAFRKLAMKLHPDKHSPESPKSIRDVSNHKFRQISQAYEFLIDDRKRADYNHRRTRNHPDYGYGYGYGHGHGHGHAHSSRYSYSYKPPPPPPPPPGGHDVWFVSRFELALPNYPCLSSQPLLYLCRVADIKRMNELEQIRLSKKTKLRRRQRRRRIL